MIYCIECTRCGLQYIGQTMNKLMMRFQAHWQTIDNKQIQYDVSKHFNGTDHQGTKDLKIYVLDFIYAHPKSEMAKSLRDTIEFHWIYRLRTSLPIGMNTMDKPPLPSKWKRYWKSFKKWSYSNGDRSLILSLFIFWLQHLQSIGQPTFFLWQLGPCGPHTTPLPHQPPPTPGQSWLQP